LLARGSGFCNVFDFERGNRKVFLYIEFKTVFQFIRIKIFGQKIALRRRTVRGKKQTEGG